MTKGRLWCKINSTNHKTDVMQTFRVLIGSALLTSSLSTLIVTPAIANKKLTGAEKTEVMQKFRDSIKKNTFEACTRTAKLNNALDKEIACSCYSERYVKQYSDSALVNIVSWMNKNPSKTSIVVYMLEPIRKFCRIP